MADLREVFPILQDESTGAGEAPISRIEGEAAASQEGLIGFSFKDSSGNVVLPQLTAEGKLPVDTEATINTCFQASGELAAGSVGTLADITGATITLTLGEVYNRMAVVCSCLRTSLFQVQHIDDDGGTPTTTVLGEFIVGPGAYTHTSELLCRELDTTGGTGVQVLKVQGKNFTHASSLRAEIACAELGAT